MTQDPTIAAGLSVNLPTGHPAASPQDDDYLIDELLEAFRQVPDEWKQDALAEIEMWARLASRQGIHIIGDDTTPPAVGARSPRPPAAPPAAPPAKDPHEKQR